MPDTSYPGSETIFRHVMDNGIVVLIYENPTAASVVVEGLIRAGSLAESREKAGLASMTAELLLRGNENRSFEEIYEAIESVGAGLDFGGGRHMTEFSSKSLAEDLALNLELISDSLRLPTFPEDQIEAIRGEIMTGLQIRANDTRRMAGLTFRESLYGDHPYGQATDGYLDSVSNISREDIVTFHDERYGPDGMIITIVGAVEQEEALAQVQAAFGNWKAKNIPMPDVPDAERPKSTLRQHVEIAGKSQSDVVLGLPGPARSAPDYLEVSMANTILGVFGMAGRLGLNVRENQGLAYYVFSHLSGGLGPSPWYVSTGIAPQNIEKGIASILHEIERIQNEPIPEDELADSQAFRTGSLPVGLETNHGLASVIGDMELYDLGLNYLQNLPDKINAMTPDIVQAAAQKYFSTEEIAIVVAGPNP